jgi:peptide/nickel transport system permease protein
MSEAERALVLREFKLDRPVWEQFGNYLTGIFRGDMGISLIYGRPVWEVVFSRLPWTLLIMACSLLISVIAGNIIGVIAAWKRGGKRDIGSLVAVMFLSSVPPFWIAMLLITLFSATLGWLPSHGAYTIGLEPGTAGYFISVIRRLIMPVLTLSIVRTGSMFLTARSSMVMAMEEDYIMLAHAKGVSEIKVVFKHALRNALLPIYTNAMVAIGHMVGGATVIETVFSYPGLGNTIYESVLARDYNLLQGSFLVISISILLTNFIADMGYPLLDPRLRRPAMA